MCLKRGATFVLAGIIVLLSACIKENRDDCFTESSYALSFIYYGNGNSDIFDSKVESVQSYIYDANGVYVDRYLSLQSDLNVFQGLVPELAPGNYEVVCWANVTGWSDITGEESEKDDAFLYSSFYLADQPITAFDSLYYGSRNFTIPVRGVVSDTVFFQSAHIGIEVYIKGLNEVETEPVRAVGDPQGWIIVRNVFTGYNFDMEVTGEMADMYPELVWEEDENILTTRFDLFRFRNENDIFIDFYHSSGARCYSLNLADYMRSNDIQVEGINEITISIYICFEGLNVHVSVEGWSSEIVEPVV